MKKERRLVLKISERLYQSIRQKNEDEYVKTSEYVNNLLEALLLPYNPWLDSEVITIMKEMERIGIERKRCDEERDNLLKLAKEKGIFNW